MSVSFVLSSCRSGKPKMKTIMPLVLVCCGWRKGTRSKPDLLRSFFKTHGFAIVRQLIPPQEHPARPPAASPPARPGPDSRGSGRAHNTNTHARTQLSCDQTGFKQVQVVSRSRQVTSQARPCQLISRQNLDALWPTQCVQTLAW